MTLTVEASPPGPVRTCVLITGERFHGELLRADQSVVEFLWQDRTRFRVPLAAVAALENPLGVIDVLDRRLSDAPAQSAELEPVSVGIAHWTPDRSGNADGQLTFGDQQLNLAATSQGVVEAELPANWSVSFHQPLRPCEVAPAVTLVWSESTWDLRVGPALWMRGTKSPAALVQASASGQRLVVRRRQSEHANLAPRSALETQDAVFRADGDVWFGDFLRTTVAGLELQGQQKTLAAVPWSEFASLHLRRRAKGSDVLQAVSGTVCEFIGPDQTDFYRLPRERWIAAQPIVPLPASVMQHPVLGQIAWPGPSFVQQQPLPARSWTWLHPLSVHLGNQVWNEGTPAFPAGTQVAGTVTWDRPPVGRCAILLDAVGLEPGGTDTVPHHRYLEQLRAARLRTELVINGETVGCWNDLLSYRPPSIAPARLRMSIPANCWKVGRNEWQIRQRPAESDRTEYDDCVLSRIALIEE